MCPEILALFLLQRSAMFELSVIVLLVLLGLVHAWLQWIACWPIIERRWRWDATGALGAPFRDAASVLDPSMPQEPPRVLVALVVAGWVLLPLALVSRLVGWCVAARDLGGASSALSAATLPTVGLCAGLVLFVSLATLAQHQAYGVCVSGEPSVVALTLRGYQRSSVLVDGALIGVLTVSVRWSTSLGRGVVAVALLMLTHLVALSVAAAIERRRAAAR